MKGSYSKIEMYLYLKIERAHITLREINVEKLTPRIFEEG